MHRDFDDFEDEHEYHRLKHKELVAQGTYEWEGEDYDPEYETDSFSIDFAKELFHALGDETKNFTGFNKADNPRDLYQPNNQTILDPSSMPDVPIDPQVFLQEVTRELNAKGVFISKDMPDLLERMCRLFNFSIQPNAELPRTVKNLVFPAQTGIGKSVSVQVYVSLLKEHSSLVVVSKVEEAVNYCNYINQLSGNSEYARCYYSITDKNKSNPMWVEAAKLRNHRCIVITHNMFRRVNVDQVQNTQKANQNVEQQKNSFIRRLDIVEYFGKYNGKLRDFVSIDEKLTFYEQYKLSYKEVDQIINNIKDATEQSTQLGALDNSHEALANFRKFKKYLSAKDDKIVTNDNSIVIQGAYSNTVKDYLATVGENPSVSKYSSERDCVTKLIGLNDKDVASNLLNSKGIGTQIRKRMIIGVPFMDVVNQRLGKYDKLDSFYCERFDPPIGNCMSKTERDELDNDNSMIDRELSAEEVALLQEKLKTINDQSGLQLTASILRVMFEVRVDELFSSLEALGARKNPVYRYGTLRVFNELLDTLDYFSAHHFLIYKSNIGNSLLATENLTNKLGLSVVLDATALINEYYQLANRFLGHVGFVNAPQIRQYKNITIKKAKGFNQSRAAIYKQAGGKEAVETTAKLYASYILNELEEKDKILIICHKDFKSMLAKATNDNRIHFTHWGNHIGRNDWADCNKVFIVGWNYMNPIEYISTINSALDSIMLTSRYLDDELIEQFQISQLADDIVQGLMRSQARRISTDDSDCNPTTFYLFYDDKDESTKVIDLVESQFPNASLVNWTPNGIAPQVKKGKRNKNADRVVEILTRKSRTDDNCTRKDVETALGISPATMGRIIEDDYFKSQLTENGMQYINSGKTHYFLLK